MAIRSFRPEDRVILTDPRYGDSPHNPVWNGTRGQVPGVIQRVSRSMGSSISVLWDNGRENTYQPEDLNFYKPLIEKPKDIEFKGKIGTIVCKLRDYYIVNFKENMKGFSCDGKYKKGSCLVIPKAETKEIKK